MKLPRMANSKHNIPIDPGKRQIAILKDYCFSSNILSNAYKDPDNPPQQFGLANIVFKQGSTVEGVLYWIDDEYIKILDDWELAYTRRLITVQNLSGESTLAYTYIGKKEREVGCLPFHPDYFQEIYEGATDPHMHVSEAYVLFLETFRPSKKTR
ncbi:MAG TPA: gamma-glutamylcyclotransferase family protein [Candidatus Saccharimonadales bacterium]|nr:gamma-glutamylcyclotransferase family protein [Candidatus Saccharimonadales bacterium]